MYYVSFNVLLIIAFTLSQLSAEFDSCAMNEIGIWTKYHEYWLRLRRSGLNVHIIRYEDIVSNPEVEYSLGFYGINDIVEHTVWYIRRFAANCSYWLHATILSCGSCSTSCNSWRTGIQTAQVAHNVVYMRIVAVAIYDWAGGDNARGCARYHDSFRISGKCSALTVL